MKQEGTSVSSNKVEPETNISSILMDQISQIVKEQRKIVLDCLDSYDVEVQEEMIRAEELASANIKKLGQWKSDLTRIFAEMSEAGFVFHLPSAETTPPVAEKPQVTAPLIASPVKETPQVTAPPVAPPVKETLQLTVPPVALPVVEEPKVTPQPIEIRKIAPTSPTEESNITRDSSQIADCCEMYFLGHSYAFETPIEFFLKVCELMVLHRPYAVGTFHENKTLNFENQINFSYYESDMNHQGIRLNNGLWVNTNQDESKISSLCYSVVTACGFSENDLKFILKGG